MGRAQQRSWLEYKGTQPTPPAGKKKKRRMRKRTRSPKKMMMKMVNLTKETVVGQTLCLKF